MTPIRIMHVIGGLSLGGAEKLTATIVEHIDKMQFATSVCSLKNAGYHGERLREQGINVYELGCTRNFSLRDVLEIAKCIWRLRVLLRQQRIDIIHTHVFGPGVVGRIAAKLAGVPIIVHTAHRLNNYGRVEPWIEKALEKITHAYVVDSTQVRTALATEYKLNATNITVIYNGIDVSEFDNLLPKPTAKAQLGLDADKKVISIVAHLSKPKAQDVYIRAFANIHEQHPDVILLLVGDGSMRENLEALVKQLDLTDHVQFLGYRKDLAHILAATDILAHPSEWEGFGIILAEAMYCEIPVITTNAGGGSEVVSHHETGILVPVGDIDGFAEATLSLLNNDELASQYGKAGRERVVKNFLKPKMLDQYKQFYQQLALSHLRVKNND